ncbi:MAG TPA: ABC transporter ATP-binding protein [Cytophagales bacterium]|nr:ABC transporter ATP-binding protein [Cytophagales bacterium]
MPIQSVIDNLLNLFSRNERNKPKLSLKERFHALKNIPRFFRLIWETNKTLTIGNITLRIVKSLFAPAILYIGKLIIDEIVEAREISNPDLSMLWIWIGVEIGLIVLSDVLTRLLTLSDSLLGDVFANNTSVKIMAHASTLDLDQFEDSKFYDKLERARQQTLGRSILMSQVLSQFQDLITVFFLGAVLIAFNPWLILLLIIAVIPAFLVESHFNEKTYSMTRSWTPERRELDYLRYIGASDETAKEVKSFGLSDFLISRFKELSNKFYLENKKIAIKRATWGSILATIGTIGYYGAYVFIILRTIQGQLTLGDLTFYSGSLSRLRGLMEGIFLRFSSIAQSALYLKDLFDFFEIRSKNELRDSYISFPAPIQKGFVFENVSFKYLDSNKYALRGVSFTLNAGEKLALVGENGAGKTTLTKLITRLYEPTEGRILLDGKDLRLYNPEQLRKNIGVIFQDYIKFQFTASNNIAVGNIDDKENRTKIVTSANKSLADQVISKLPKQYDQMIGKRFAEGVDLSGGEWQKLALARAYMRDAQVMILDEPTAALDAKAENEVFIRFSEITKGKTAILISHRFSTVRMADRILVLENGEMAEMGSHEELLALKGKYHTLFNLQAKGYL